MGTIDLAEPTDGPTVTRLQALARELEVVLVVPFYERGGFVRVPGPAQHLDPRGQQRLEPGGAVEPAHGDGEADPQGLEHVEHGARLAAHDDADALGGVPGLGDRAVDESGRGAEVGSLDVGRDADEPLRGKPVDLAGSHAAAHIRHIAEHQVGEIVDLAQGDGFHLAGRGHALGGNKHFHLVVESGGGVLPEVERHIPAGVGGHKHRVADVLGVHPAQAGLLAVDVDIHRGVVERLPELDIAETWDLGHLALDFFRVGPHLRQARTINDHLERRGRPEAHHIRDHVARFEPERDIARPGIGGLPVEARADEFPRQPRGDLPGQDFPEPFPERIEAHARSLAQRHAEHAVVGAAHEQDDIVQAEVRGDLPGESDADVDRVLAAFALDHAEDLLGVVLGGALDDGFFDRVQRIGEEEDHGNKD